MTRPRPNLPLPAFALALVLGQTPAAAQSELHHQDQPEGSPILAYYDFEEPTPSGPDTYWLRAQSGASVDLSAAFRAAGERSLHVREVPENRDFAEFLGYFDERLSGDVFVQFYVLFTDLDQRFNFGLAGPRWFLSSEQHGHAVWLETHGGKLWHRPAGRQAEVFTPRPFTWYFVDLVYDVDGGAYDLRIFEESCGAECTEPLVDLRRQRNFADQDRSSVRFFSFIGDLEDEGRFDYFVDDVLLASDPAVRLKPFVAPGRRRFFVELYAGGREPLADAARQDLLWEAREWLRGRPGPEAAELPDADRLERAADEAFLSGDLALAREIYELMATDPQRRPRLELKLSDVAYLSGDVAAERELREAIYGRLDLEELAPR
jgi:hypothetical protein